MIASWQTRHLKGTEGMTTFDKATTTRLQIFFLFVYCLEQGRLKGLYTRLEINEIGGQREHILY